MSNQSDSSTDICKTASKPCYSFILTGDESNDATDSKAMRGGMRPGFGGFALCSRTKVEKLDMLQAYIFQPKGVIEQM